MQEPLRVDREGTIVLGDNNLPDIVSERILHAIINDLDGAMRTYADAYRLRPEMFGTIAMALTSAPQGRLWLDEAALRRALDLRS